MTVIIYHEVKKGIPCPDGQAAAWIAHKVYPEAEIIGCVYGDPLPEEIDDGEKVIIVDFSFPTQLLESLADRGCKLTVIDHHKTALENLSTLSDRILQRFDMEECGATLTWKYFFPDQPYPHFLLYVRDRDLWQHQLPMTHEIHAAIGHIGRSFALYDSFEHLSQEQLQAAFGNLGAKLLEEKRSKVELIAAHAEMYVISTPEAKYTVPGVILRFDGSEDYLVSDICDRLYTHLYPTAEFVFCSTSEHTISLRSNKDESNFDVSAIAKYFGGGGHRNAAGFTKYPDGAIALVDPEIKRFECAAKIPAAEYEGAVQDPRDDKFYESVTGLLESYHGKDAAPPTYAWACDISPVELSDARTQIEEMLEDKELDEVFAPEDFTDVWILDEAIDNFNQQNANKVAWTLREYDLAVTIGGLIDEQ